MINSIKFNHSIYSSYCLQNSRKISFGSSFDLKTDYSKKVLEISKSLLSSGKSVTLSDFLKVLDIPVVLLSKSEQKSLNEIAQLTYDIDIDDFSISNYAIKVPSCVNSNSKARTYAVMNFAHEYTHYMQSQNGSLAIKKLLQDCSDIGIKSESTLVNIAENAKNIVNSLIPEHLKQSASQIFGPKLRKNSNKNYGLAIFCTDFSKDSIARTFGFDDEKTFIQNGLDEMTVFDYIVDSLLENNDELKRMYVLNPGLKQQLKNALIMFVCKTMENEAEASLVEYNLALSQGYNDVNSKFAYLFYDLFCAAMRT